MEPLSRSIFDQLYDTFSNEPRPTKIDASPYSMEARQIDQLLFTPLRQITPDELRKYASSAFLTVGSELDFRYFLPRILEILATDPGWWPDPEVVGKAMANVPWERWTELQQEALAAYFDSVYDILLTAPAPDGFEIDSWLCCTSHVLPHWELVLTRLTIHPKALVALYERHSQSLQKQRLGNGFWDQSPKKQVFLNWMLSDQVKLLVMTEWGL